MKSLNAFLLVLAMTAAISCAKDSEKDSQKDSAGSIPISSTAQARIEGTEGGNGGDPNEIKFREVAFNIQQWIESGNADDLSLPSNLTISRYKEQMLPALRNYHISFTADKVLVDGNEKLCRNFKDDLQENQILCQAAAFSVLLSSDLNSVYQIVHHEFAGLAGLENNKGTDSDYTISHQISGYLRDELLKRLPVVRSSPSPIAGGGSVKDCSINSMIPLIVNELSRTINAAMEESGVIVDANSISVNYRGIVKWKEYGEESEEGAFDVAFRSSNGTLIALTTHGTEKLGGDYSGLLLIPIPTLEVERYPDGNPKKSVCVAKPYNGVNRSWLFTTVAQKFVIRDDLVSCGVGCTGYSSFYIRAEVTR